MELNIGAILISNKILDENYLPKWMYREIPDNEGDSGWRIFSGEETDEYLENPHNFSFVSSDQLIAIDGNIMSNLLAPPGFSFERRAGSDEWYIVDEPAN